MTMPLPAGTVPAAAVLLECPDCHGPLAFVADGFQCEGCGATHPVVDGVPHFITDAPYWGEPGISQEVARDIAAQSATTSWHQVFATYPSSIVRQQYRFIADRNRADWQRLVPLKSDDVVLDVGAGMGTISAALSSHCRHVYAVEPVAERSAFLPHRFRQDGCTNVTVVRSSIDRLPFPDGAFDLVVLNGVLEWLPFSRREESPRDAQLHYLRLVRRLLKPGGTLYVGIENRLCIEYFLGLGDPHIGVPGVTILPRFAADAICRRRIGDRYLPWLYSHKGYERLLRDAGFRQADIYSALPSYNDPRYIRPLTDPSRLFADTIWQTRRPILRAVKRLLISIDCLKYFGYAYAAFGRT